MPSYPSSGAGRRASGATPSPRRRAVRGQPRHGNGMIDAGHGGGRTDLLIPGSWVRAPPAPPIARCRPRATSGPRTPTAGCRVILAAAADALRPQRRARKIGYRPARHGELRAMTEPLRSLLHASHLLAPDDLAATV